MLLPNSHHLLDLGKDLPLSKNKTVETGRDLQKVIDSLVVMESKQMGREIICCQT